MKKIHRVFDSKGLSMAKALVYETYQPHVIEKIGFATQESLELFELIKIKAIADLNHLFDTLKHEHAQQADIMLAHIEMIKDPLIYDEVLKSLEKKHHLSYAIYHAFGTYMDTLNALDDPYLKERSQDLNDVRIRLMKLIDGYQDIDLSKLDQAYIIIARELMPSDTASLDLKHVKGFITEIGGKTSHSVILAKSFSMPACVGVNNILKDVKHHDLLILNSETDEIIINPTQVEIDLFHQIKQAYDQKMDIVNTYKSKEALTKDGIKIDINLNISSSSVSEEVVSITDGVGLYRTEFLYMQSKEEPSLELQVLAYEQVLKAYQGKPVIIRSLDVGGDKKIDYIKQEQENNPFLGHRGVRLTLTYTQLFKTQIKAFLIANKYRNLKVMFPMVTSLDDILNIKQLIEICKKELDNENKTYYPFKFGVMIEVPSMIFILDKIIPLIDFASIGTNDLTQYLLAVDRMNQTLRDFDQTFAPSLIRALYTIINTFNEHDKDISICGELAGDVRATKLLLGMGLKKFSMSESQIPFVKMQIANTTMDEAKQILLKVLNLNTEAEIKTFLITQK